MNTAATRPSQSNSNQPEQVLYVAFELSSRLCHRDLRLEPADDIEQPDHSLPHG